MTIRQEDWEVLGIEPDSDLATVKRAYRHRRSLYEPSALATYSLLDDKERSDMIERIEDAYRRIIKVEEKPEPAIESLLETEEIVEMPTGPAPDPCDHPGAYLRYHRLRKGLSIERIAAATKIGASILGQIEREDLGALPAEVFVRGHVIQFAREVGLDDVDDFAKVFLAMMTRGNDDEDV